MAQSNKNITDIDWGFITETIKNEKCILFIGPELFKNENNSTLEEQMSEYLNVGKNPDIQNFYKKDGLFSFTSGTKKTKSYYKIKKFYSQPFPKSEAIFKDLAKIPFHFIISITPDKKCYETFESLGLKSKFHFYWKKQKVDNIIGKPTIKNPIIYNMFGCIDRQDSMVFTYDDLFDYFESIFQENSMPEKLKINLKEAHNFIFLGLDFEKWYMQILLRVLYLHNDKYEFMRYAANQQVNDKLKAFCYQQFKIEFVPTQIEDFVNELYEECEKIGLLRQKEEKQISVIEQYKSWLAQNRIEDVLNGIKEFLENLGEIGEDLIQRVFLLTSRYKDLNRSMGLGILEQRDIQLETNKIRLSLIEILKEAKEFE